MRDFSLPGRSAVHATNVMAATSHPLATASALDILRRGGIAMDAAIAAAAVLAVVEPAETGIGGDCFALVAPGGRVPPIAFNGSGRAPAAAELAWYRDRGMTEIPDDSAHSVTVPGAVDAWTQLHERFGRMEFADLVRPAIRYAEDGYIVHARVAQEWALAGHRLARHPEAAAIFLRDGKSPACGALMRNPGLAKSLRLIAEKGRSGFYEGETADAVVTHLRGSGGLHTLEDFAEAAGEYVEPLAYDYRGRTLYQLPPNTQGCIATLILALMDRFGPGDMDFLSAERIHLAIEAGRISYGLRDAMLGDAERSAGLLELIADPRAVSRLAAGIEARERRADLPPVKVVGANTVYLTVVDGDQTAVSFINSIYHSFGSGLCPPDTGILLQNRGRSFRLQEGHPNAIGPRRRPMHTIIPGLAGRAGRAELSFGVMGGDYQPMGHAHVLSALFDHGLDLQAACDAPRYLPVGDHVEVETGIEPGTRETLRRWGHNIAAAPQPLGGAQLIAIDWQDGILTGASDPRKDGCALGY